MSFDRISRTWLRVLFVLPLLALAPLALSPAGGVEENRACATDTCAPEVQNFCDRDGNIIWDFYNQRADDIWP